VPGPPTPAGETQGLLNKKPARPDARGRSRDGMSKARQLITLASERHDLGTFPVEKVARLATELAVHIGYNPGTARRVLLAHVRQLQAQNAMPATPTVRDQR